MYTSTVLATLFTASTIASPVANIALNARTPAEARAQAAQAQLDVLVANGCDILGCLAAVAPTSAVCAAALAEEGVNVVADVACFSGVVSALDNPPAACAGC